MSSERNEDPMQEEKERTMYIANLHEKVTEELLYELFVQVTDLLRRHRDIDC